MYIQHLVGERHFIQYGCRFVVVIVMSGFLKMLHFVVKFESGTGN